MQFRQARQEAGVNATEAAKRAGLQRSTIHDIERGEYNSVRLETALRLSRAIGANPADIDEFKSSAAMLEAVAAVS